MIGGGQGDLVIDLVRAAAELQIPPRHRATLGVRHDIHLSRTGRVQHPVYERADLPGGGDRITHTAAAGQHRAQTAALQSSRP